MLETTYTKLRAELAAVLDRVTADQEIVIVRRRGARDVAMIPAEELSSLMETARLLRSPKNAQRLLRALRRAERGGASLRRSKACAARLDLPRGLDREAIFHPGFREDLRYWVSADRKVALKILDS